MKPGVRPYRMTARADAAAATGERVLDAAEALFWEQPAAEQTLEAIAGRAGVSVQTVIRRFGSRDGVRGAAISRAADRVGAQRAEARPGDVAGAAGVIVEHYEQVGDGVMRMLAEEERTPALGRIVAGGRSGHVAWCERVFGPFLASLRGAERARRLGQLVAVCDVYTWKLLRRDHGLSRRQTELALRELLVPLTEGAP
jgi:AcrR family transcriptional regulator